jgi:hypothetical protein
MYNIVNPLEMTRKEFEGYVTIHNLEYYNAQQLAAYGKDVESLIQKAQFEELSPEDKEQLDIFKGDMATLTKVVVVNDDLSKEPLFFRKKGEGMIEKSHKANVGEIRVWNGKKFKKQGNGKWVEVSESHGLTSKEHKEKGKHSGDESYKHTIIGHKLSDKEYSDEEVMGGGMIEKSHKANVGEIRVWNGKKMKKQANGKWLEVSDKGMTKREHKEKHDINYHKSSQPGVSYNSLRKLRSVADDHKWLSDKLSDKEYSDEEVMGGGEKKEEKIGDSVQIRTDKANIGEIREWGGKKMKKQANGKWVEVSEQGETKVSHIYQAKYAKEESKKPSLHTSKHEDAERWHREQAAKLSDKEYSDEEVGLGKKGIPGGFKIGDDVVTASGIKGKN